MELLNATALIKAIEDTPIRKLNILPSELQNIIKNVQGTPLQKYFETVKLLINVLRGADQLGSGS